MHRFHRRRAAPGAVAALAALLAASTSAAQDASDRGATVYVSPDGDDAWSGSTPAPDADRTDGPFRTIRRAAEALRPGGTCLIRAGVYREVLKPARSGEAGRPLTFRNYGDETVVLSGADVLEGWTRLEGELHVAAMPWDLADQNQVFCSDAALTEARWPDNPTGSLLKPRRATAASGTAKTLTDPAIPGDARTWKGASLWCAGGSQWVAWTVNVAGFDAATKTITFDKAKEGRWYQVRKGNPYVIMGSFGALDCAGEWWYDRPGECLLLRPPEGVDLANAKIEARRRLHCIDLSGRSHVEIVGLRFRAGGVLTDGGTTNVRLSRCVGTYVAHSYVRDVGGEAGVLIRGRDNVVEDCELAYSSSSILSVSGSGHRIVNCYIHDGNYGGKWKGTVALTGRRHLFSHNTVRHSGRDLVSVHGLMESLVQYNDLSDAGWLTDDLGMTYGHNTDFMNSVFRYNVVHDNRAHHCAMGIYFDHCSQNAIVHHNVVFNAAMDPIRFNNPGYYDLVFNNSCFNCGRVGTFDHSKRNDLFGMRLINNIFNEDIRLPDHVVLERNLVAPDPGYATPARRDFRLRRGSKAVDAGTVLEGVTPRHTGRAPDLGALEGGRRPWKAGHDFERPPSPAPAWEPADVAWMNLVRNSCFELAQLEGWKRTAGEATLAQGNGWGNGYGKGPVQKTGTNKRELKLGAGRAAVEQTIEGIHPRTAYTLSGWLKASGATAQLGVRHPNGEEAVASSSSSEWTRVTVEFVTGRDQAKVTVFVRKASEGGHAFADNIGLPRSPRGYAGTGVRARR